MVVRGWAKTATVDWKRVVAPHAFRVPMRDLRQLLWDEDQVDGNTQKRFEAWARGDVRDVRFEVDTRIASEMKPGCGVPDYNDLDLYCVQNEAESLEADNPGLAESVYMGLTESLGMHYEMIDDSMGTFWPMFEKCLGAMSGCIRRQKLTAEDKEWRIEYYAGWSAAVFPDFMAYYERLLADLCTSSEDLNLWKRILVDKLQHADVCDSHRAYYHKPLLERMDARLQDKTKEENGAS